MSTSLSLWLGIAFVLIGAINVCLILQASVRVRDAKAGARLVAAHRIGGYLFISLFCGIGYFMVARLGDGAQSASSGTVIHLTLAMVLGPLLFVKVLVARYYKNHYALLLPIGLMIFVLSFVLIGITAGPYLARQSRIQTVWIAAIDQPPTAIDLNLAAATMEKRCSKCHNLDRVVGARKDARGWLATVNRMRALPDAEIPEADARLIVSYLASRMAPRGPANLEVARALVDQRCGRCHALDRVYKTTETPAEWSDTVARMADYAAGSAGAFQPGEAEQIVAYLSATQTAAAVAQRRTQAPAAASVSTPPDQPAPRRGYDNKTIGFFSAVFLGLVTLMIRRPVRTGAAPAPPLAPAVAPPTAPLILRLAGITSQTSDSKTLRFIVPDDRKFSARPGQFLTFAFLFDGKKVTRSYSICSSPARSGYVEITPKRVNQGCVSVFLNDRASIGMTVEAKGPFGGFYFDESKHQSVVLLAAGSGITPMMAMLRYIDDLCLDTPAVLLYCVRTAGDIMFESELQSLCSRLRNFRYRVLLSQPHEEWRGPRGHVNREFISTAVPDLASPEFFLCGPPPFMEAVRKILADLGVTSERIRQESFGGTVPKDQVPQSGVAVEFARSGKTCVVRGGQSILEAAEEHGVAIPSSCRQGQCGTCKTRLLEGEVRMQSEQGLDPDSRSRGFVLTCVGHPKGPVRLDA